MIRSCIIASLLFTTLLAHAQVVPLEHAHAHNDYVHKRPLMEALENGFTSIEIDVFLHNDNLVVSHIAVGLNKKPKIEELYLKPIADIIAKNGGYVYKGYTTPVIFMVDFKTDNEPTYRKLKEILQPYKHLLTQYKNGKVIKQGPLEILISGGGPYRLLMEEDTSYTTIDGGIGSMDNEERNRVITRFSSAWQSYFSWMGTLNLPATSKAKLDSLVAGAHNKGKHIRFYAIPDKPKVWKTLLDAKVDWINTNKLAAYRRFYEQYKKAH